MASTIAGGHYRGLSMTRKRRRRIWEDDEKRRIVAQTRVPGISVSQVARRVNPGATLVSFPERYWPVYWRLVASAPHVADARQGALAAGQFGAASMVV